MAGKLFHRMTCSVALFICFQTNCHAADAASFELLSGNKSRMSSLGLQWKWDKKWLAGEQLEAAGFWDLKLSRWQNRQYLNIPDNTQSINDLGIAASFRLQEKERIGFYVEAATGPHWLSERYDNNGRRQGSRIVFETQAGIGYVWKNGIDMGLKAMHMSNGGFRDPNDCVNLYGLSLRYWWR